MENYRPKNIIIATGIYPPDIGGPATYSVFLSEELTKRGWNVCIITYGNEKIKNQKSKIKNYESDLTPGVFKISRKSNVFFRYLTYFLWVWRLAKRADIVYALDPVSAGLPAVLAARLCGKKAYLRLGGDWLWEKAVEEGRTGLPLTAYYEKHSDWSGRERLRSRFLNRLLRLFDGFIFSTDWQRRI